MPTTPSIDRAEPVDILLVDDRPTNLSTLEAILRRPDYNLVMARSGAEALSSILRHEFAVILLDVAMPEMDGFETANIIKEREQSKQIPIIFVTASVYDMEHIFHGYTAGAVDYLRKPIDAHELRSKVAVFVELFRQRKHIERQARHLEDIELQTHRLRAEEALYQLTFEQAPIGIGHATPEGRWIQANSRLCEILDRAHDDLIGQRVTALVDSDETADLAAALSQLEAGTITLCAREHRISVSPREMRVAVTISSLRNSADRVVRLIVVIDEISARTQDCIEPMSKGVSNSR